MTRQSIIYYCYIIFIFISLKYLFKISDDNDIWVLIAPVSKLITLITNIKSVYLENTGYFYRDINVLINKSCSGGNFYILCVVILQIAVKPIVKMKLQSLIIFSGVFLAAYLLTVLTNTSRILISIYLKDFMKPLPRSHEVIGAFIYLFFLISIYFSAVAIISKIRKNEKNF